MTRSLGYEPSPQEHVADLVAELQTDPLQVSMLTWRELHPRLSAGRVRNLGQTITYLYGYMNRSGGQPNPADRVLATCEPEDHIVLGLN